MTDLTPEQWRNKLLKDLSLRRLDVDLHYCYYRGDHPLPWAVDEVRDAYRAFLQMSRSNWCRLVVKAPSERLRPIGIRFSKGKGSRSPNASGDVKAWERYWQGNRLDAECRMVHDAALIARRGFALVWPRDGLAPSITPEHPSQVIVEHAPGDRRIRRAGLKTFIDPIEKRSYCTLWLPEKVYSWTAPNKSGGDVMPSRWEPWEDEAQGIMPEATNPMSEVSLVEFVADPALTGEPMSELDGGVLDIQDRINKTILDRLTAANFSSFQQKWATGLEIPKDPDTGEQVSPFKAAVDRVWINENPAGAFGAFPVADLKPYLDAVEADIQHLAAQTRTPPHYLLGQSGAFPSGESLKATETGLVAKVMERRDSFTESWEDVIRLALKADDDPRADDMAMSVLWKDPESRTVAEVMDATTKMQAVGVPYRERLAFMGYSPTEIERLVEERKEDVANGFEPAMSSNPPAAGPGRVTGQP